MRSRLPTILLCAAVVLLAVQVAPAAGTGADLVEVDVQRSADGVLVVMHDTTLERTTNAEEVFPDREDYDLADFTFAELRQLDAGSWFDESFAGEKIPTLDEVLAALPGSAGLLLEVKSPELYPGLAEDVAEALARWPGYVRAHPRAQRLVVQSFDWDFMAEYHALQPNVAVGLLGGPPSDADLADFAGWVDHVNPSHTAVDADVIDRVHELGMQVNVYTVNDPDRMGELVELGVDGIITNHPDVLSRVLRGHPGVDADPIAITAVVGDAPAMTSPAEPVSTSPSPTPATRRSTSATGTCATAPTTASTSATATSSRPAPRCRSSPGPATTTPSTASTAAAPPSSTTAATP
ncbi:MAG TPA: glycerophosphodiester phosphodiesterase family protein [Egibacteraceae bacterium]